MIKSKRLKDNIMEITSTTSNKADLLSVLDAVIKHRKKGFKILLSTSLPIDEFYKQFGMACAKKVGMAQLLKDTIIGEGDPIPYELVGRLTLDTYIPEDYFLKSTADNTVYEIKEVRDNESKVN